jgi:L-ascorbate metabolism protein UlaG (beta-lactamase superfamily)
MLGVVNGYVIEHNSPNGPYRLYWTGDTVWFDGLPEIRRRAGLVNLVIPHIGAVGRDGPWGRMTLDAREALDVLALFAPARMIPIHHHTFSHYVEPVDALQTIAAGEGLGARLTVLRESEETALA